MILKFDTVLPCLSLPMETNITNDEDDLEDQEMEANREHLIQQYEESLQSWYGLII